MDITGAAALAALTLTYICILVLLNKNNLRKIGSNDFLRGFNRLFGLFLIYCLFSLAYAADKPAALTDFLRLLSVLAGVNYAVIYYSGKDNLLKLFKLISLAAIFPLFLGLYQLISKKGIPELGFNRLYASFLHPNVFAQFLVFIFFILLYLLMNDKARTRAKLYLWLLTALTLLELFFTYTRGAWIALFISVSLYFLINTRPSLKLKFIFFGLIVFLCALPAIQKRFSDIEESKSYQLSSWQWRLKQWGSTLDSLKEHPIVGNGLGMYEKNFKIMAHNDYLRIAYETGFPGMILYVGVQLYLLALSFKGGGRSKIALSLIVSVIIMGAADNLARSTMILLYVFIAIGCLLSDKYESLAGK